VSDWSAAPDAQTLTAWVDEARSRTLALIADLDDDQLTVPYLPIVNPLLWELGHVAWFQEQWVLRHVLGRAPRLARGDALFDSARVGHESRWYLALPERAEVEAYARGVRDDVLAHLAGAELEADLAYFLQLSVFHEDMHHEAFLYMRQSLGYPAPAQLRAAPRSDGIEPAVDIVVPGHRFELGAEPGAHFVFDNEKWEHPVELGDFAIASRPVTQAEFAAFVEGGGYGERQAWSATCWSWREAAGAEHPVYWRRVGGAWQRRQFDRWVELEPDLPVLHVNGYEADAWCRWAGRRLPSEAEWEAAASALPGGQPPAKQRFPWGDEAPNESRANLDARVLGCINADDLPAGASGLGCRQMIGNVWEWTATDFDAYPGFTPDPYKEYSKPWFGARRVLRGGSWATRGRLLRSTWRNFFTPDRRDVFAGFRSCAPLC
jgi:iron(II)-dependent oxidoreductase